MHRLLKPTVPWTSVGIYSVEPLYGIASDKAYFACPVVTNLGITYIAEDPNKQPVVNVAPAAAPLVWSVYETGGEDGGVTSFADANGLGGTVDGNEATLNTSITGMLIGDGEAIGEAEVGTDYSVGTSALASGILSSTTGTGALATIPTVGTGNLSPLTATGVGFTPTLTCTTPGDLAVTYSSQTGLVTRIGNLVIVRFSLVTSAFTYTTASGILQLQTLPIAGEAAYEGSMTAVGWGNVSYQQVNASLSSNKILLIGSGTGGSGFLNVTDFASGGLVNISGTLVYVAA